ncbi:thiamine diphosphate-binding protein [Epithele typhae]|uniref:thiamine diphosphate-binding protein n=1 Tax=Epithele typhae TaxID=378194 RepID=UPI002007F714|nr:thiamine diphosphate-binding protein [Epithele typhae]KAH9932830.1 thiamine diphosphate-binding protein [Epithele typhae]
MYTTASLFFRTLSSYGITHAFVNWGSDHSAFLEDLQRQRLESGDGTTLIEIVTCPSEYIALSAAHGYALVTGRPAAVIVHVDVGTQSMAGAVHNADRGQVPIFIFSGGAPFSANGELRGSKNEYIMWLQDVPDQPAIVRQYMRYTGQIHSPKNAAKVIARALQICTSQPKGPVYLWARREVTDEEIDEEVLNAKVPFHKWPSVTLPALTSEVVDTITSALCTASFPLIITACAGRNPAAVPLLTSLAAALEVGVLTAFGAVVNIPYSDPHSLGYAFHGTLPHIADADAILLLDTEVPWIDVANAGPKPGAKVFVVNNDPLKRTHGWHHVDADLVCVADAATALAQLLAAARADLTSPNPRLTAERLAARRAHIARLRTAHVDGLAEAERVPAAALADRPSVPAVLGALRAAADGQRRTVLFLNEAVSASGLVWNHLAPDAAGSMFMSGGTSIGWVLGGAIGACLGSQVRARAGEGAGGFELVVAVSGDGNFLFGVPTAAFWAARRYRAPFLTSPQFSISKDRLTVGFGDDSADYGGVAAAAGGAWSARVSRADALQATFEQAVKVVLEEKRCAVVECLVLLNYAACMNSLDFGFKG